MTVLRKHFLAKVFALITGVIFLNTSFFLAEISLLKVTNFELLQNVAKLMSNSGLEEERDGETSDKDSSAKEVDLLISQVQIHHEVLFLTATKACHALDDLYPHANYSQTFSPPPDFI
ncbi:MAG TPA: hypothetical protein VFU05_17095 [Cyclobacteriaceae bacterium]|nr:hypothetical protein [Cyclobacteriaceae bacterium]